MATLSTSLRMNICPATSARSYRQQKRWRRMILSFKSMWQHLKRCSQGLGSQRDQCPLGATWIPAEYVQQFLEELLDAPYYTRRMVKVEFAAYTGSWAITNKKFGDGNIKATVTYGTNRANAYLIAENA